jgi:hypothetical protein
MLLYPLVIKHGNAKLKFLFKFDNHAKHVDIFYLSSLNLCRVAMVIPIDMEMDDSPWTCDMMVVPHRKYGMFGAVRFFPNIWTTTASSLLLRFGRGRSLQRFGETESLVAHWKSLPTRWVWGDHILNESHLWIPFFRSCMWDDFSHLNIWVVPSGPILV